jgi:hypothetical protein
MSTPVWGAFMGANSGQPPYEMRPTHRSQTVYPAYKLQPLIGSVISKISFRTSGSPATFTWEATGTVKLANTTATNVRNDFIDFATLSPVSVCTGEFKVQNRVMEFEFDTPLLYQGGSLIFDLNKTPGTGVDKDAVFYGGSTCYADDPWNTAWQNNPDNYCSRSHIYINKNETHLVSHWRFPEITFTYFPSGHHLITASTSTGGTITPTGGIAVQEGGSQTFNFTANTGYTISQVLIDGVNNPAAVSAGSYTFSNVTATHTIRVEFAPNQYIITASVAGAHGTISPSGEVQVSHGGSAKFTFTPNVGYKVAQVLIDGVNNPTAVNVGSYTFSNITGPHTIEVSFEALPETFTIVASVSGGNGTITPSGTITVSSGENKTFTITPNSGYIIAKVLVDGTNNQNAISTGSYTFTNITANHTIETSFVAETTPTYSVTIQQPANGKIDVEDITNSIVIQSGALVAPGTELEINVTTNNNYEFQSILINNVVYSQTTPANFTMGKENIVIAANIHLGVNEFLLSGVTVYTQQNRVFIVNEKNIKLKSIQVIDLLGRAMYERSAVSSTSFSVDTATGLYIVKLISEDDKVLTTKVYLSK